MALAEVSVDPETGRITAMMLKDRVEAGAEILRLMGCDQDPEVVSLLKAARAARQRAQEIYRASIEMQSKMNCHPEKLN